MKKHKHTWNYMMAGESLRMFRINKRCPCGKIFWYKEGLLYMQRNNIPSVRYNWITDPADVIEATTNPLITLSLN